MMPWILRGYRRGVDFWAGGMHLTIRMERGKSAEGRVWAASAWAWLPNLDGMILKLSPRKEAFDW